MRFSELIKLLEQHGFRLVRGIRFYSILCPTGNSEIDSSLYGNAILFRQLGYLPPIGFEPAGKRYSVLTAKP